ncbi:MAG: hypothetical protein ACK4GQ_04785 [Candidatus Hadarchaeales archaeon]
MMHRGASHHRISPVAALAVVLLLLSSPAVAAIHSSDVQISPTVVLENSSTVYIVTVKNTGENDSIDNVVIELPENFVIENENISLPSGWSSLRLGQKITYATVTDRILPGASRSFQLQSKSPDLPTPYRSDFGWSITTYDNGTSPGSVPTTSVVGVVPAMFSPTGHSDAPVDIDNDGLYDYLTVNVHLNVGTAGRYSVSASLYENGTEKYITWGYSWDDLPAGESIVQLKFVSCWCCLLRLSGFSSAARHP